GETPSPSAAVAVSEGKKASAAHSSATSEGRRLTLASVVARRLGMVRFMVLSTVTPLALQTPESPRGNRRRRGPDKPGLSPAARLKQSGNPRRHETAMGALTL